MGVEQAQLLRPMRGIVGIVDVEQQSFRRACIRVDKLIDQYVGNTVQITRTHRVLKTGHGRLACQIVFGRQSITRLFEAWINSEIIRVVGVLVAAGDLINRLCKEVLTIMSHITLMTGIHDRLGKLIDDTKPVGYLSQHEYSSIRTNITTRRRA